MARIRVRVFAAGSDPAHDRHLYGVRPSVAMDLVNTRRAVQINKRAIQLVAATLSAVSQAVQQAAYYDHAANLPPVGYRILSRGPLMFDQMWEARSSDGFRVMQLCPPSPKPTLQTSEEI